MNKILTLFSLLIAFSATHVSADCIEAYSSKKSSGGIKRHERHQILDLLDDTKGDLIAQARFIHDSFQYGYSGGCDKSELLNLVYTAYDALPNKESFKLLSIAKLSAQILRNANQTEFLCPKDKKAMGYEEIVQYTRDEVVKKLSVLKD